MGYNIGPKIGIEGESEFRNQIKKINAEYKTLEAETRAVTAAFEKNGDEQGKLEATTKQLEKQLDKQKQKMELLEDAVRKATEKFGEESVEANRLRGVLYDTQATVSKLEGALDDARDQLNDAGESMEDFSEETDNAGDSALEFGNILGANLCADLAADAVRDLTDAVIDFAAESIDKAAEVKASNSQLEQTFAGLETESASALKSIEKQTGISSTRIQDSFTKLFAFAKTSGADASEALELSERAMVAAADSAAYYDKSVEEAAETLQSFLKGNYANDAALGIACTETTRNAEANRLYAKSFKDLSESQKVDVLLSMVEAANSASGALGQAAREADSWTNVTGEAAEAIHQLQAAVGEPLLEAAIPIVQGFTDAIKGLTEVSDVVKLRDQMSDLSATMQSANDEYDNATMKTEVAADAARRYIERLEELEAAGLDNSQAQYDYQRIVGELNALIPTLNLVIDEQTGLLVENKKAILEDVDAWIKVQNTASLREKMEKQAQSLADAKMTVFEARHQLTALEEDAAEIEEALSQKSAELASVDAELNDIINTMGSGTQTSNFAFEESAQRQYELSTESERLNRELAELRSALGNNTAEQRILNDTISEGEQLISDYGDQLKETSDMMSAYDSEVSLAADAQVKIQDQIQALQGKLDALAEAYDSAKTEALDSINTQIGLFDEIATKSDWSAEKIIKNWESQQQAFANYSANLQKAVDMGLDQALVQQLSDGSEQSMQILHALVNDTDVSIAEINASFRGLSQAKNTTAETMAEIETSFSEHWGRIVQAAKDAGLDVVDGAVVAISQNAYKLAGAMRDMASRGIDTYRVTFDINSPSRVMEDNTEFVVDGAVISIEKHLGEFEAAMAHMATAGQEAYLEEQLLRADNYPIVYSPAVQQSGGNTYERHYGGFNISIYQQPGQDPGDVADMVMDRLQAMVDSKEAGL